MPEAFETYLKEVGKQIRWQRARGPLLQELRTHLLDERDAYLTGGLTEEQAESQALRQMGDPVTVGQELDRVHKPKPQWNLLILTGALAAAGTLVRVYLTNGWSRGMVELQPALLSICVGVGLLVLGYFADHTNGGRIGKWTYVIVIGIVGFSLLIGLDYRDIQLYAYRGCAYLLFAYVSWLYGWRGAGKRGMWAAFLGVLPMVALYSTGGALSGIPVILITTLVLFWVLAQNDWFAIGKRKTRCFALGITVFVGLLGVFAVLRHPYFRDAVRYAFHPELDPESRGALGLLVRDILHNAQWTGAGAWSGVTVDGKLLPYEACFTDAGGEFLLTTVIHRLGWLPCLLLLAVFLGIVIWCLVRGLRQKSVLAKLTVVSIIVPLILQGIYAIFANLGFVLFTIPFPLITGNQTMVIHMFLIGIVLSVFRQETLPMAPKYGSGQPKHE